MTEPRPAEPARPRLVRQGLELGQKLLPLLAGSAHYYHLDPADWHSVLHGIKSLGLTLVDTYVPWDLHETNGDFDFGRVDPRLDVRRFLGLAQQEGLYAIVRPGPHVNAELTRFGLPERIVWDEEIMARSPSGAPVVLPVPPLAFPVPSYASRKFMKEVEAWYQRVADELGELCFPNGPIVMLQVDNEGAMYFRDGVFEQDYHSDAIESYRAYLKVKYESLEEVRRLYKNPALRLSKAQPPDRLSTTTISALTPTLDWALHNELMVARSLAQMASMLRSRFPNVPLSHNLPPGWDRSVLDPTLLERDIDLVGADYYHRANTDQRRTIFETTSDLASRADTLCRPAYAAELGAGFPPYFEALSEGDSAFGAMCALAYGINAFNVYMAVDRDRWVGAPLDAHGRPTSFASFFERLIAAVERTSLHSLRRHTQVRLVVPRVVRRLNRALHCFGPLGPTLFGALGASPTKSLLENEFGMASSVAMDTARFVELLSTLLHESHVPFSLYCAEHVDVGSFNGHWSIVLSNSSLAPDFRERVFAAMAKGKAVTLAPHFPDLDEDLRPHAVTPSLPPSPSGIPPLLGLHPPAIRRAVQTALRVLKLGRELLTPTELYGSLLSDSEGTPKVAFIINPTDDDIAASWSFDRDVRARDALSGTAVDISERALKLLIGKRSVSMLELDWLS